MTARVEKLSVTLGVEEVAWARQQAEASGLSLSAVLTETVRRQSKLDAMASLLAALGTDDITEEDRAAIRAEWRPSPAHAGSSSVAERARERERLLSRLNEIVQERETITSQLEANGGAVLFNMAQYK